jgi:hypothetical protein
MKMLTCATNVVRHCAIPVVGVTNATKKKTTHRIGLKTTTCVSSATDPIVRSAANAMTAMARVTTNDAPSSLGKT